MVKNGMTQKQIAIELGFKTPFTLILRLIKASQTSGNPVPQFRPRKKDAPAKTVEIVEVKKRGRREGCGLNIPQEPLLRVGAQPRTKLSVKASKGRIALTVK